MPTPNRPSLSSLQEQLRRRLSELRAEVDARDPPASDVEDAGHEVRDRKDEANELSFAETEAAELGRDLDELEQVLGALRRIEAGTYGACTDCGEAIPLERLRVQPAAERCAACQTAREGRQRTR